MRPSEQVVLESTKNGFQCCYRLFSGGLFVQVRERLVLYDEKRAGYQATWRTLSTVAVHFETSRESARRVVEHHTGYHDADLAQTLAPIWAAWDAAPVAELAIEPTPEPSAETSQSPVGKGASVRPIRGERSR